MHILYHKFHMWKVFSSHEQKLCESLILISLHILCHKYDMYVVSFSHEHLRNWKDIQSCGILHKMMRIVYLCIDELSNIVPTVLAIRNTRIPIASYYGYHNVFNSQELQSWKYVPDIGYFLGVLKHQTASRSLAPSQYNYRYPINPLL